MYVLGVILARAGSKGLPDKCVRPLLGRPLIEHTLEHARAARRLDHIVFTTDSAPASDVARRFGVEVIARPADLATDTATVDSAARHAVEDVEARGGKLTDVVVLLYGNIPVRSSGVIDRAIEHLIETGADSVRTVAAVGKHHPDWLYRVAGDRMVQYRENSIYRRQDLEPLYYHDAAVLAVTRRALYTPPKHEHDYHAFLGADRRCVVQGPEDAVDVDTAMDLRVAEAVLRTRCADRSGAPA